MYLLYKSPYRNFDGLNTLTRVIRSQSIQNKVGIALFQDAVISLRGILGEKIAELLEGDIEVIVLAEDLNARGIDLEIEGVKLVNYRELINIIINNYDKIVSWG
ncbi:MAG: DsrH/TusB family sulfur metabolism protein [Candidatus Hodarchaeota archaeon]